MPGWNFWMGSSPDFFWGPMSILADADKKLNRRLGEVPEK